MIIFVIIILAALLVALFIDWNALVGKLPKRSPRHLEGKRRPRLLAREKAQPVATQVPEQINEVSAQVEQVPAASSSKYSAEVEELLNQADIHFRKSELKAAEKFYLQAASIDPRCSKAYSRLGVIYLENGEEWEDAEAAFRQALKTDPSNGYILNNLGLVLYHQDKYADAIRNFEAAVRLDEQNASRHANLGMAYMAMRQYAKAESSFKKAMKLAPNELEYKDLLSEAVDKKIAHKTLIRR